MEKLEDAVRKGKITPKIAESLKNINIVKFEFGDFVEVVDAVLEHIDINPKDFWNGKI